MPDSNVMSIVGSIWCRTICVLERMEIAIDTCCKRTTLCHDVHPDSEKPEVGVDDIEMEFKLQLASLKAAWYPVKDQLAPFAKDLVEWVAGREGQGLPVSAVDEMALELLSTVQGEESHRSAPAEGSEPTESSEAPSSMGGEVQLVIDDHSHARGPFDAGMVRLKSLFPNSARVLEQVAGVGSESAQRTDEPKESS